MNNRQFFLEKKARWVRLQVLKKIFETGRGHIGGTFSCVEILVALYLGSILRISTKKPNLKTRDRFILSKGHASLALYAIFYDLKIISKKKYESYGYDGGLGGQLDISIAGVDFNTGSLGHAVGVAAGMALASRVDKNPFKVVTLLGDSEFFEGSVWEALVFAESYKLNNLIVVVDRNRFMVTDFLEDEGPFLEFESKIRSFGWEYFEIDGHNFEQIFDVFKKIEFVRKPSLLVANTIRGKGVSFFENNIDWYTKAPNRREFELAKAELISARSNE